MQDSLTNDHLSVATAAFVEYATAVDEARVDDFVNLFTPDAVFYRLDVVGHSAIAQLTREMLVQYTATSHHISNVRILGGDDEEFQAACHIYAWHHLLDGTDFEIWGQYRSRLRVHDGKWRFSRHTARAAGVRPDGAMGQIAMVPRRALN